jgi:hypothetical protein
LKSKFNGKSFIISKESIFMKFIKKYTAILLVLIVVITQSGVASAANNPSPGSPPEQRPARKCVIKFEGSPISVIDSGNYVEAEYTVDDNCKPVLLEVREGRLSDLKEEQIAVTSAASESADFSLKSHSDVSTAAINTNVCKTETWQTDFAYIATTRVQNETTYNWDGSYLNFWGVRGISSEYFYWWYRYNGPNKNGYWEPYPTAAKGKADASYYCNGGPFCQGGPKYYITLEAWTRVDAYGSCSGWGVYSGTVIPGGHVLYRNWKE